MKERLLQIKKFFAFYVLIPLFLDLIIESLNRKSLWEGLSYMVEKPFLFLFNVLIIMLTMSVAMFFRREIFVLSMISMIWLLFGVVNFVILHFRVTPFSAVDFTLISSAISVSGHYLSVMNVAMIVLAVLILIVALVCLFRKAPCFHSNVSRRAYIISAMVMAVLVVSILLIHRSSTSVQALADNYTNISEAYENYGFVYCFTNSILDTGIDKPENYSEEEMERVRESIGKSAGSGEVKPDIVMLQLESFFDVCAVERLRLSKDPLPVFHKLQEECSSGLLTVPTVGAGTVNTEFEVLTGMSQHDFGVSEYPYKTALKSKTSESICRDLAELGYSSHAIHNNTATFYGRNTVFSNLGFDSFTSIEYMQQIEWNPNGWAKDDALVNEVMKVLDSSEDSQFVFGITVQSHGKYEGVHTEGKQPITVYEAPGPGEETYQYYVNQIYEVDQMLGRLVSELKRRKKPTVLVLYGDHLPSLELRDEDFNGRDLYQTEYVIWNNYGLKEEDQDLASYQLYSEVLDQAGIHQGILTGYHQKADWESETYREDLKLIEYDILYGEKYLYNGMEYYEPTNLQMGTKPVQITDVNTWKDAEKADKLRSWEIAGGRDTSKGYLVTGRNFTPYCHLIWNGHMLETVWIDDEHLYVQTNEELFWSPGGKLSIEKLMQRSFTVEVQNGDGVSLSESRPLRWRNSSLNVR